MNRSSVTTSVAPASPTAAARSGVVSTVVGVAATTVALGASALLIRHFLALRSQPTSGPDLHLRTGEDDDLIAAARRDATAELATRVAHEVNNPLTGVLGYAELALAALGPDDPIRADIETIRAEALRARSIIQDLVRGARAGVDPAPATQATPQPFDALDNGPMPEGSAA